jgi:glycosyltransferase involved in cell wall biosynthesis
VGKLAAAPLTLRANFDLQPSFMLIYAFLEHYPSPYKPYFDAQFEQFLRDGHELRNFAFDQSPGPIPEKVRTLGLDRATSYLPSRLSAVPRFLGRLLGHFLADPFGTMARCWRVAKQGGGIKQVLMGILRTVLLPKTAPDLCLVHNLITQRNLQFLRHLYPGVPVAFYYHGGEVPGVPTVSDRDAAAAFAAADTVFTNTNDSRQHAIGRGCAPDKIVISPMGFNLREFEPLPNRVFRRDGKLNLITISRLSEEKGLRFAIEAMRQLRDSGFDDLSLRIIGGGPLSASLRAMVAEYELEDCIQFLGVVSFQEIHDELGGADVLLLPSIVLRTWQENQACVVQEAMLMRTLVATSTAGGVPESTAPELRQFNYPAGDASALAGAILRLRELDPARMEQLGEAGRQFAIQGYDIARLNAGLLEAAMARKPR